MDGLWWICPRYGLALAQMFLSKCFDFNHDLGFSEYIAAAGCSWNFVMNFVPLSSYTSFLTKINDVCSMYQACLIKHVALLK